MKPETVFGSSAVVPSRNRDRSWRPLADDRRRADSSSKGPSHHGALACVDRGDHELAFARPRLATGLAPCRGMSYVCDPTIFTAFRSLGFSLVNTAVTIHSQRMSTV
jgi:hypothetical protein